MTCKTIDLYCKKCKKSFKTSHLVTGMDETPVLPNVIMKCHHCTRAVILKKYTEKMLIEGSKNGQSFI